MLDRHTLLMACLAAVVAAPPTSAFDASDGTHHECSAGPREGGPPLKVHDFYSDNPSFLDTGYTAFATYDPSGKPIVHLSEPRMSVLSPVAQKFIFYHECAHLWTRDDTVGRELSANCSAIRHMRRSKLLRSTEAGELRDFIRALPESLPLYPDGKTQWEKMKDCR